MINQLSNSGRSRRGNALNKEVNLRLIEVLNNNLIKSYTYEPRYSFPGYEKEQFSPDGEIVLNNNTVIIIDNTTSIRHDRLKQKQWDAYGIKNYFKITHPDIEVKYFVILPDIQNIINSELEIKNIEREKKKIFSSSYYSEIDNILHISDFLNLIKKNDE